MDRSCVCGHSEPWHAGENGECLVRPNSVLSSAVRATEKCECSVPAVRATEKCECSVFDAAVSVEESKGKTE